MIIKLGVCVFSTVLIYGSSKGGGGQLGLTIIYVQIFRNKKSK